MKGFYHFYLLKAIPLLGVVTGGLTFATYMSYRAIFIYPDVV